MPRDVLSDKILQRILSHPNVKGMNKQSVRNAISKIHKDNYGVTMDAAGCEYAKRKSFSIYRSLGPADKQSLQFIRQREVTETLIRKQEMRPKTISEKLDIQTPFIREANDNAAAYFYIYVLENSLRKIILEKLGQGQDWWTDKGKVLEDIQIYAARIQQAEKKYPWMKERGDHPLYYVGLYELFKIIETNWKLGFKDVFDDLELLRAWMKESVPIRNLIAHNVKTRLQERQNIKMKTDYISRLIERWYKEHSPNQVNTAN